jgi:hypothetical protein
MISHYPYYRHPNVWQSLSLAWRREWAHRTGKGAEPPPVVQRNLTDYTLSQDYLPNLEALRDELAARGRYAVFAEAGSPSFIDNTGAGWYASPVIGNAQPINGVPHAETIIAGGLTWHRVDCGTVAQIKVVWCGHVRFVFANDDDIRRYGLFILTGSGKVLAWGDDRYEVRGSAGFDIERSTGLVGNVPAGDGWERIGIASDWGASGTPFGNQLVANGMGYAIRGSEVRTWGRTTSIDVAEVVWDLNYSAGLTFTQPIMLDELREGGPSSVGRQMFVLGSPASFQWVPCAVLTDNRPVALNPFVAFKPTVPRYYRPPLFYWPSIPAELDVIDIESPFEEDPNKFMP